MANDGFNGTTLTWGAGGETPLQSVNDNQTGAKVDVTGSTSPQHQYVAGLKDQDIDFTVVGNSTVQVGDTTSLTIAWFDGTTDALGVWNCVGRAKSGAVDGTVTTTITAAYFST